MSAGRYDLEIEQGSDFVLNILYQDTNDAALDLGTYTARMQIRESSDSSSSIIELTNANSRITLGAVDPNIVLTLSAGDTASMDFDTAFYDLEVISSSATVSKVLRGSVKLIREFTK
tara:strand:+ start:80 stop:430 length:351 start_codon:yes stop_codon:yes gene_type:complete